MSRPAPPLDPNEMTPAKLVGMIDELAELPYGLEVVDQRTHALQCAANARAAGADDTLVAAALLHDIGRHPLVARQFRGPHEDAGRAFCTLSLGERLGWLVWAHVPAKRYLVATDPMYDRTLSHASTMSLSRQGGAMTPDELAEFAAHPWCDDALALRRWDEAAKEPEFVPPPAEAYLEVVSDLWLS